MKLEAGIASVAITAYRQALEEQGFVIVKKDLTVEMLEAVLKSDICPACGYDGYWGYNHPEHGDEPFRKNIRDIFSALIAASPKPEE